MHNGRDALRLTHRRLLSEVVPPLVGEPSSDTSEDQNHSEKYFIVKEPHHGLQGFVAIEANEDGFKAETQTSSSQASNDERALGHVAHACHPSEHL